MAAKLGFLYIDTGAMYRAVALWAMRLNVALSDMHRLEQLAEQAEIEFVAGREHDPAERRRCHGRDPRRRNGRSRVQSFAQCPAVRRALVKKPAGDGPQSVGRDGRPRYRDGGFSGSRRQDFSGCACRSSAPSGAPASWRCLRRRSRRSCDERDHRDRTRAEAPLVQAPDAVYVDTTGLIDRRSGAGIAEDHPGAHLQRKGTHAL